MVFGAPIHATCGAILGPGPAKAAMARPAAGRAPSPSLAAPEVLPSAGTSQAGPRLPSMHHLGRPCITFGLEICNTKDTISIVRCLVYLIEILQSIAWDQGAAKLLLHGGTEAAWKQEEAWQTRRRARTACLLYGAFHPFQACDMHAHRQHLSYLYGQSSL